MNNKFLVACDGQTVIVTSVIGQILYFATNDKVLYARDDTPPEDKIAFEKMADQLFKDWQEHQSDCGSKNGHAITGEVIKANTQDLTNQLKEFLNDLGANNNDESLADQLFKMPPQGKFSIN